MYYTLNLFLYKEEEGGNSEGYSDFYCFDLLIF
jgi:hypothetical protein